VFTFNVTVGSDDGLQGENCGRSSKAETFREWVKKMGKKKVILDPVKTFASLFPRGEERGEPSFIDNDGVKLDLNFINKAATILFKSIPLYNTLSNHVRTGEWQH
jgi:hypothetical protein